ncbi:hypothetical protein IQ17_03181 [Bradyrhizobium daqingense]|uniref:Uncharacterized protein n=1 Tax=Bradyrhizobium daqingense TaxID=993502 RepID=A0A562LDG4_9BRAD|nr:hypothetical protein IQ17_03181 [Bradyrhizobium daqingense]
MAQNCRFRPKRLKPPVNYAKTHVNRAFPALTAAFAGTMKRAHDTT